METILALLVLVLVALGSGFERVFCKGKGNSGGSKFGDDE